MLLYMRRKATSYKIIQILEGVKHSQIIHFRRDSNQVSIFKFIELQIK